jgi:hypothetical protein
MTESEFAGYVLGKRFGCNFRVSAIGPGPNAILTLDGDIYTISLAELRVLIERGLISERP